MNVYLFYIIYIKVEGLKLTSLTEFKKHLGNALREFDFEWSCVEPGVGLACSFPPKVHFWKISTDGNMLIV